MEIAKSLKEIGFNKPCIFSYSEGIGVTARPYNHDSVKIYDKLLEASNYDCTDTLAEFVNFKTSNGLLQFSVYNCQNGYYGHSVYIKFNDTEIKSEV